MKPLKQRNQAAVGAVTVMLIVLSALAAYNANDLPLIGGGTTYTAHFAESADLQPENEVQVAGVRVGEVTEVELDGKQVLVTFRIQRQGVASTSRLGADTEASIEIKTLLGEKFVALRPRGEGTLDPNTPIPVERTTTPFQVQDAFDQLETTVSDVDTEQLAESFDVLSDTFADTPEHLRDAMSGLSALSRTLSSRDDELSTLLANTSQMSETLAGRNETIKQVIGDSNLLLAELQQRKDAIRQLLTGTRTLSAELSGLVEDNREQLRPALDELNKVTDVLQRNQDNLSRSLELLAPFTRMGANVTGNGRWFEGYLCGLVPPTVTTDAVTFNPQGCESPAAAPDQGIGGGN
jgi:phospholipid/cholesterol/gamma-HCH transport system substrate-binding protein